MDSSQNTPPDSAAPHKSISRKLTASMTLAILALAMSIFIAVYVGITMRNVMQTFKSTFQTLTLLNGQNKTILQANLLLQNQAQQNKQQITNLQQLTSGNRKVWVLSEVDYLVKLAHYNLNVMHNVPVATALLQSANERLSGLDDPTLTSLRQQVVNNVTRLQAIPSVDVTGILMQLNALIDQTKQLPLVSPPSFIKHPQVISKEDSLLTGWHKALKNSINTIETLVIIRHHNQPISSLLQPEEQYYLQENLKLILQQAQWAVLQRQSDVYQNSLEQAGNWISQYYAQDAPATRAFHHSLDQLLKIDIKPDVPDITDLMQSVQQAMSQH